MDKKWNIQTKSKTQRKCPNAAESEITTYSPAIATAKWVLLEARWCPPAGIVIRFGWPRAYAMLFWCISLLLQSPPRKREQSLRCKTAWHNWKRQSTSSLSQCFRTWNQAVYKQAYLSDYVFLCFLSILGKKWMHISLINIYINILMSIKSTFNNFKHRKSVPLTD